MQRITLLLTVVAVGILAILMALFWRQRNEALQQLSISTHSLAEAEAGRDQAELAQATAIAESQLRAAAQKEAEAVSATAVAEAQIQATAQAQTEVARAKVEEQYQAALAQKLGAQAQLRLEETPDPTVGSLLAVESLKRFPSVEGDIPLHHGIELLSWEPVLEASAGDCGPISFSEDGKRLAILDRSCRHPEDATITVWDVDTQQEIIQFDPNKEGSETTDIALSSDGSWLGVGSYYYATLQILAVDTQEQLIQTTSREGWAFSPDSRRLAVISDENTVSIWNLSRKQVEFQLSHEQKVSDIVFSPDGRWIASQGEDKIWLWDLKTRKLTQSYEGSEPLFSVNGQFLATIQADDTVHIWDVTEEQEIVWPASDIPISAIAFSPDSRWLVTVRAQPAIQVWEIATGLEVAQILPGSYVGGITFSPDGRWLGGSGDGVTRLWEVGSWRESARIPLSPMAMTFSADGGRLALLAYNRGAEVWQIRPSGLELAKMSLGEALYQLAFSPDGKWVAAGANNGAVRIWEAATGREMARMSHSAWVRGLAFSSDNKWLVTGSEDHTVRVWEVPGGNEVARLATDGMVEAVALSLDGRWVASSGYPKGVRIWDLESGQEVAQLDTIGSANLAFSPDSQLLATGGIEPAIWKVATGEKITQLPFDTGMSELSFSPDGRFLVVGTRGNAGVVWDVTTSREVAQLEHDYSNITRVLFSPDGQWLATGTNLIEPWEPSGDVRIWAVANWQQVSQMESGQVYNMTFSPDSQWLVTGKARIWDVATGQEVGRIPHENAFITVFSPDGHTIATAGSDGTTRIWLWQPQDLIEEACARLTRNMTKVEWRQYLGDEPYQATCPNLPMLQN